MATIRSFIAVEVPFFQSVEEGARNLQSAGLRAKFVEPHNLHLTVKFLGDIDEADVPGILDAMRAAASGISPFEMGLKGVGFFPGGNRVNVIWLGVEGSSPLREFEERLSGEFESAGIRPPKMDNRSFRPHLTIARVKNPGNKRELLEIIDSYKETEFGRISVGEILLKKSVLQREGPVYTTLGSVEL